MIVRPATPMDLEPICLMGQRMATEGWWKGQPYSLQKTFEVGRRVLMEPDACLLVAEHQSKLVGFLLGEVSSSIWNDIKGAEEHLLFVEKGFRGATVAKALLEAFLAWAAKKGASEVYFSPSMDPEKPDRWDGLTKALGMTKTGCNYRMRLSYAA